MLPVFAWNIDREIAGVGPFALRYYSLLFAGGILLGYFLVRKMFRNEGRSEAVLDSVLLHIVIGTVVGARLGHCLFYEPETYLSEPLRILRIWEGGLASHGGFLGVILALMWFCRRHRDVGFFWLIDRVTPPTMLAAAMIRLGNFFNSEIYGRPSDVSWAVVFKKVDEIPRHPTQLYEALAYAAVGAVVYAYYRMRHREVPEGRLLGLAMILAFTFRIAIEPLKVNQVDFEEGLFLNMGQLLSLPYIAVGIALVAGWHRRVTWLAWAFSDYEPAAPDATHQTGSGDVEAPARRGQLRRQMRRTKR